METSNQIRSIFPSLLFTSLSPSLPLPLSLFYLSLVIYLSIFYLSSLSHLSSVCLMASLLLKTDSQRWQTTYHTRISISTSD